MKKMAYHIILIAVILLSCETKLTELQPGKTTKLKTGEACILHLKESHEDGST